MHACLSLTNYLLCYFELLNILLPGIYSDIRGVAVEGVEGESVSLTEPVTEAIAAAFAGWLSNKKKSEGSKCLRVSIGHDSRISAKNLQVISSFLSLKWNLN